METQEDLRDHTIGELFGRLSRELSLLVQQEIELAKTELKEQARVLGVAGGFLGAGAALGLGAFGALTAAIILAIALVLPAWAAALIVAIGYGMIAAIFALVGAKRARAAQPPLPQTVETLKENIEWAKTRARSGIKS
jgi:uncharacterized membrane protein YqjE